MNWAVEQIAKLDAIEIESEVEDDEKRVPDCNAIRSYRPRPPPPPLRAEAPSPPRLMVPACSPPPTPPHTPSLQPRPLAHPMYHPLCRAV